MDIVCLGCLLDVPKEVASKQLDSRAGGPWRGPVWKCTFGGWWCRNGMKKMSLDLFPSCSLVLTLAVRGLP